MSGIGEKVGRRSKGKRAVLLPHGNTRNTAGCPFQGMTDKHRTQVCMHLKGKLLLSL